MLPSLRRVRGHLTFPDGAHPTVFHVRQGFHAPIPFASSDAGFEIESPTHACEVEVSGPGFMTRSIRILAGDNDVTWKEAVR